MAIAVFCQQLSSFGADRARALVQSGTVNAIYVLMHPNQEAAQANHEEYGKFAGMPLWAWINASADQAADVEAVREIDAKFKPIGYQLDIEGEWTKTANLRTLITGVKSLGKPVRASLAAATASHVSYDYRTLDAHAVPIDWQCYFDSGEGPQPDVGVTELFKSSFVIAGWEYRCKLGTRYGWGKAGNVEGGNMIFDPSRPGEREASFSVTPREWGFGVKDRVVLRDGLEVGQLMGRARYRCIGVTLDTTRGANDKHSLVEWTAIASSARALAWLGVRSACTWLRTPRMPYCALSLPVHRERSF